MTHSPAGIHVLAKPIGSVCDIACDYCFYLEMEGVRLLQKYQVEFNALACVGRDTALKPLEVYRFFKEAGIHYLCAGYKKFFRHIRKYLRAMATLIENDLPVSAVMQAIDGPLIITRSADHAK